MKLTKLTKKVVVCMFALILMFCLCISVSAADEDTSALDDDALDAGESVTYIGEVTADETQTIEDDLSSTCVLSMTINGTETEFDAGTAYGDGDDDVIVIKATAILGTICEFTGGDESDYYYRSALYISSGGLDEDMSVLSAVQSIDSDVTFDDVSDYLTTDDDGNITISGIDVESTSSSFSSVMINNEDGTDTLNVSIEDSLFNALSDSDGSDVNDFSGLGSTISAFGDVMLTVDDTEVNTTGVAKVAFLAADGADLLVTDSTFDVAGGTLYEGYESTADQSAMVAPPWVLGISGNARGTNLLGTDSTSTFIDSDFTTTAWGVLSVDAGSDGIINVANCTLTQTSATGYGIYGIGNSIETFYGCTFDVGTYAAILTGGTITFTDLDAGQTITTYSNADSTTPVVEYTTDYDGADAQVTTVNSQFGVMNHGTADITLEDGTVFNTANAAFLCKNGDATISVDNSELNVEDGVILQVMDNDDSTVGVQTDSDSGLSVVFNTEMTEEEGYPTDAYSEETSGTVSATFTNVDLDGDMYNASGYVATAQALEVTLGEGATLEGVITASSSIHVQMELNDETGLYEYVTDDDGNYVQATTITIDEYYELGHVANIAYTNGYNTTDVTLTDDASWTVTGTCYLSSLTIGDDATIENATMTVDGVATDIEAGQTYTGVIVLTAVDADSDTSDDTDPADTDGDGVPDDMPEIPDSDDGTTDDTDTDDTDDTDTDDTDTSDDTDTDDTDTDDTDTDDTDTSDDTEEVTITSGDATVTGDIPEDCVFTYEAFDTDSDEYEEVAEILAGDDYDDLGTFVVYDLDLTEDGVTVELSDDGVEVTMPVPSALSDADEIAVYVMEEDGTLTELTATLNDDGTITFTAPHFSTYVFAEVTSSDSATSTSTSSSDSDTSTVSTGDSSSVVLWISLSTCVLLAAGGATYYNNRRKSFN